MPSYRPGEVGASVAVCVATDLGKSEPVWRCAQLQTWGSRSECGGVRIATDLGKSEPVWWCVQLQTWGSLSQCGGVRSYRPEEVRASVVVVMMCLGKRRVGQSYHYTGRERERGGEGSRGVFVPSSQLTLQYQQSQRVYSEWQTANSPYRSTHPFRFFRCKGKLKEMWQYKGYIHLYKSAHSIKHIMTKLHTVVCIKIES